MSGGTGRGQMRRRPRDPLVWSKLSGRAFTHGPSGYTKHGCGCDTCFDGWHTSPAWLREEALREKARRASVTNSQADAP